MKALDWRQIFLAIFGLAGVMFILWSIGIAPTEALWEVVIGSMGSKGAWNETIRQTSPLLLTGIAVYLALRAGLFNIGAEGQLLVGALCASTVALNVPNTLGLILSLVVGAIAGGLWALPAGLIKAHRNGHEVITTIMLNNVAAALTVALVAGPLQSREGLGTATDSINQAAWLPSVFESMPLRINSSLVFVLLAIAVSAFWLKRTVDGYELRATGANATAARHAGVDVKRVTVRAMTVSGVIAGLAGAVQVLAYDHYFYEGFSAGFGFDALGVAILAGNSPWGVLPSALFFGVLAKGSTSLQTLGVPRGLSGIMLGILLIVFAASRVKEQRRSA